MNLQRLKCRAFGCLTSEYGSNYCIRCDARVWHDPRWVEWPQGWFSRWTHRRMSIALWIARRFRRRCDNCRARLPFRESKRHGHDGAYCSKKCYDNHIPF